MISYLDHNISLRRRETGSSEVCLGSNADLLYVLLQAYLVFMQTNPINPDRFLVGCLSGDQEDVQDFLGEASKA